METIIRSIGNEKQLFIDNWIVSDAWTAHRKVHQPLKHPANPLITGDNEWEKDRVCVYGAVAPRPGGGYRMWYQPVLDDKGRRGTGESMQHYRICYAESDDGIEWIKPNLGLHDWRGSTENNLVIPEDATNDIGEPLTNITGAQSFSVLLEPGPAADDGLLHGFSLLNPQDIDEALCHLVSEDGLNWHRAPGGFPMITGHSDTPNNVVWNPTLGKYMCVMRPNVYANAAGFGKRRIAISLSDDLVEWTQQEIVLFPDEADPEGVEHLYGMGVFPYEGMWLGTLEVYDDDRGVMELQLAHSRDGLEWQRLPTREPLIPWGEEGAFDHSIIHTSVRPFVKDGRIWMYYDGTNDHHHAIYDWHTPSEGQFGAIGLATWRLDGFVSRSAYNEGYVLTRPFHCEGDRLLVNARVAPRGVLAAEVLEVDTASNDQFNSTKTAEGYSKEDCVAFEDDSVETEIKWGEGKNLAPFQGKVIRLRFHLSYTDLYAFWIGE